MAGRICHPSRLWGQGRRHNLSDQEHDQYTAACDQYRRKLTANRVALYPTTMPQIVMDSYRDRPWDRSLADPSYNPVQHFSPLSRSPPLRRLAQTPAKAHLRAWVHYLRPSGLAPPPSGTQRAAREPAAADAGASGAQRQSHVHHQAQRAAQPGDANKRACNSAPQRDDRGAADNVGEENRRLANINETLGVLRVARGAPA